MVRKNVTLLTVDVEKEKVIIGETLIRVGDKCKIKNLSLQLKNTKKRGLYLVVSPGENKKKYGLKLENFARYEIGPKYWVKIAKENLVPNFFKGI